jgi:hypothetical protein
MADDGVIERNKRLPDEHDDAEPVSILHASADLRESEFMRLYLRGPLGVRYKGIECARRVGYSGEDNALAARASELLHRPRNLLKLQRAIDRNDVGLDRVVYELKCLGFARMSDYATWDNTGVAIKSSTELDDDQLAAVVVVEEYPLGTTRGIRVKLGDKIGALALLAKLNRLVASDPTDADQSEQQPFTLVLGQQQHVHFHTHQPNSNGAPDANGHATPPPSGEEDEV